MIQFTKIVPYRTADPKDAFALFVSKIEQRYPSNVYVFHIV